MFGGKASQATTTSHAQDGAFSPRIACSDSAGKNTPVIPAERGIIGGVEAVGPELAEGDLSHPWVLERSVGRLRSSAIRGRLAFVVVSVRGNIVGSFVAVL